MNLLKHIDELEKGFFSTLENIEIPDINLDIHPIVVKILKKCLNENRKHTYDDCIEYLDDDYFLDQLQENVNKWIRDIKNLCNLDRDPSTGSVLQEVNFWLNIEKELEKINEKRDSTEVIITLDFLKYSKHFVAIVSFDSAIASLKETIKNVKDYNLFFKDLLLNNLLSASDLNQITVYIEYILNHLRKIRNSKYSFDKLFKLIEAISNDLQMQLVKILNTSSLMSINYDNFEKIYNAILTVFQVWDDEYEKFQSFLREIAKRKRQDPKSMWRINSSHKQVQNRLIQIKQLYINFLCCKNKNKLKVS